MIAIASIGRSTSANTSSSSFSPGIAVGGGAASPRFSCTCRVERRFINPLLAGRLQRWLIAFRIILVQGGEQTPECFQCINTNQGRAYFELEASWIEHPV